MDTVNLNSGLFNARVLSHHQFKKFCGRQQISTWQFSLPISSEMAE